MNKLRAAAAAGLRDLVRRVATRGKRVSGGSAEVTSRPRRRGARVHVLRGVVMIAVACRVPLPFPELPPVGDPSFDAAIVANHAAIEKRDEPTEKNQRLACIWPTANEQAHVGGRLMPRVVHVIGTYPHQDSYGRVQVKVLPAGETNLNKWIPVPADELHYSGCGQEFNAFRELDAARREPPVNQ